LRTRRGRFSLRSYCMALQYVILLRNLGVANNIQIVEAEFVVRRVGDVAGVGRAALGVRQPVRDNAR